MQEVFSMSLLTSKSYMKICYLKFMYMVKLSRSLCWAIMKKMTKKWDLETSNAEMEPKIGIYTKNWARQAMLKIFDLVKKSTQKSTVNSGGQRSEVNGQRSTEIQLLTRGTNVSWWCRRWHGQMLKVLGACNACRHVMARYPTREARVHYWWCMKRVSDG